MDIKANKSDEYQKFLINMHRYYEKTLDEFSSELWLGLAKEFGEEKIMTVCRKHFLDPENGRFMPKLADISKILGGTGKELGQVAWSKFIRAVKMVGTYETVVFDDYIIHMVCDAMGGYIAAGMWSEKDLGYKQNDFINLYKHYYSTIGKKEWIKKLIGRIEADNPNIEHSIIFVGDKEKCRIVFEKGESASLDVSRIDFKSAVNYISDNNKLLIKSAV